MEFLLENWLYIVALVFFVGLHFLGSGCGIGHRSRRGRKVNTGMQVPAELPNGGSLPQLAGKLEKPSIRSWV